jgi:hypothetical protein
MLPTTNQLPTLGNMHKVVCDCLGLWNSDNEDITFHVTATEKDRRTALQEAFKSIRKEDGTYGSLDDLVKITTKLAPKDAQKVKKSRTIQAYVNHLSKTDFETIDEFSELHQYIEVMITERFSRWDVSELAVDFYRSALNYYREFVREYACNTQSQNYSYLCFLSQDLRLLIQTLTDNLLTNDTWPDSSRDTTWPLKDFADEACKVAGVSLHKLHQYHEFQQEKLLGEKAWNLNFTSQKVNTRSKQVIDRLRKNSRMKWETFYPTLQPLTFHLPDTTSKKAFAIHAFKAMLIHNLNVHLADYGPFEPPIQSNLKQEQIEYKHSIPSSDQLDKLFNGETIGDETFIQQTLNRYHASINRIRTLPSSLNFTTNIPNCIEQIYKKEHLRHFEDEWHVTLVKAPNWINEWILARTALLNGDAPLALSHFTTALEQARYAAGPLFIPFYIQVCAFCKSQYQLLKKKNEEELFDRFYEGFGSNASSYAILMGYVPKFERDAMTLMPSSTLPGKFKLINEEVNAMTKSFLN